MWIEKVSTSVFTLNFVMCKSCKYLFRVVFFLVAVKPNWVSRFQHRRVQVRCVLHHKFQVFCFLFCTIHFYSWFYFIEIYSRAEFVCVFFSRCHFEIIPHSFQLIYTHLKWTKMNHRFDEWDVLPHTTSISQYQRAVGVLYGYLLLLLLLLRVYNE